MSETPVIAIEGVHKSFGKKQVLHDVSILVKRGEVFGFLGPNGSGKSTTIRVLLGVIYPSSGNVAFFGESDYTAPHVHRRIGYLAGDMVLDEDLTGKQYLAYVSGQYGKNCDDKIVHLTKMLQADLGKKIRQYSRGNRQKIGLIAALMHEPDLLVLDEPTSGFDPLIQEQFIRLIHDFKASGGTVFMSSHILSEVQHLCDRVAFIKEGRIVATKKVADLEASTTKQLRIVAETAVLNRLLGAAKKITGLQLALQQDGVISGTYAGKPKDLLQFLGNYTIRDITIGDPDLDEVFMKYYETVEVDNA
jgi:ABC-2 type transport system ATP-binding protein